MRKLLDVGFHVFSLVRPFGFDPGGELTYNAFWSCSKAFVIPLNWEMTRDRWVSVCRAILIALQISYNLHWVPGLFGTRPPNNSKKTPKIQKKIQQVINHSFTISRFTIQHLKAGLGR